jgi:hypothetical protein
MIGKVNMRQRSYSLLVSLGLLLRPTGWMISSGSKKSEDITTAAELRATFPTLLCMRQRIGVKYHT